MLDRVRTTLRYETYAGPFGPEWMMLHGPAEGPGVLILPPLFAEHNMTRALVVDIARSLAAHGIGSAVPDLPGTGESLQPLADVGFQDWRAAAAAAARSLGLPHVVALRGGALLDDALAARSHWRFAAAAGADMLRHLERAQMIADREGDRAAPGGETVALAGYRLSPLLCVALRVAEPVVPAGPLRALPFEGPGLAPWRRAEPARDPALAARLADDIAAWIRACDA